MTQEISMSQGETITLEFTFPSGDDLTPFETMRFFAWTGAGATPWGVQGAPGDGVFELSGQVLTVTLASSLTQGLTLSNAANGFFWDLRLIDNPRQLVVASGSLEMAASPSFTV